MLKTFEIDPEIFRAYDIRGIAHENLSEQAVFNIGKALGSLVLKKDGKEIIIARDGRVSGPALIQVLCKGILSTGCNVLDIGMVPTPLLYFSTFKFETNSGVILTGSHNPQEYNGLKMVIGGKALCEAEIKELYECVKKQDYTAGQGQYRKANIQEQYQQEIINNIMLERPLKVVVDCGNGIAGNIAPQLYKAMGCEVIELYCNVDGNFPNHHPDPSQPDNLQKLIEKMKLLHADIGLAFDGDGDRLGVVTTKGEIIWPDRQLILFAKNILQKSPGAKIIYDVKCTTYLKQEIDAAGGIPIMWKTGHSLIKSKLAETNAVLAGEMSGHLFFKDKWYGFDDAIYAGARLLQILSCHQGDSDSLFAMIPNSINTPELKILVADELKFSLMERLIKNAIFDKADISTIDGLRVNFNDGWGLVRPSNTTPCLVLRFEAKSKEVLNQIQQIFRDFLLSVEPTLVLPF